MKSQTLSNTTQCPVCSSPISELERTPICAICAFRSALAGPEFDGNAAGNGIGPNPESHTRFGEFELLEEIAQGGMGVVWKARQIGLDRTVALKLILTGRFATADAISRFRVEAAAAGQLRHPGIVTVFGTGECQGHHYIAMQYVDGTTLAGVAASRGPLPPKQAADYVRKIALAVQHAHEHGILHRDLKPSNILIDPQGQPLVTDFGIAKQLTADQSLTVTGQMLGSPNYSPPEQLGHTGHRPSTASDVYSLGAILYHLVTGRPPFAAALLTDVLQRVLNQPAIPPRELDPHIPKAIDTICLKCLAKEPAQRYGTALELAGDLDRFLQGEPIHARPISPAVKAIAWSRRNKLASAFILVLVASVVGTSYLLSQLLVQQSRSENQMAVIRERLLLSIQEVWLEPERLSETVNSDTLAALMNSPRPPLGPGFPMTLTLGVTAQLDPISQMIRYEPMLRKLEQRMSYELKAPVQFSLQLAKFNTIDYKSLQRGDLTLRRMGALSYLNLQQRLTNCVALVQEDRTKDCVIFVHNDSPVHSLQELAGHSVAFGDAFSTISMLAKVQLSRAGVQGTNLSRWEHLDSHSAFLEQIRKQSRAAQGAQAPALNSHMEVIRAVREKRFDAGVARKAHIEGDSQRSFRILAEFESPPNTWVSNAQVARHITDSLIHCLTQPDVYRQNAEANADSIIRFLPVGPDYLASLRSAMTNELSRFEGPHPIQSLSLGDEE